MPFNTHGFADVDYKSYYQQYAAPFLSEVNEENNDFFLKEAQQSHVYGINNALNEVITDAALLTSFPLSPEAESHLRYGVLRRLRMISTSFRHFQALVPPNRSVPLVFEQSDDVSRYLNSIYIDLLGLMDNYAWTLTHQFGSQKTLAANKMEIGLFKPTLAKDPALSSIIREILSFAGWEKEVKERRNPAAHRMPLYVSSAAFNPDDALEYRRLGELASSALGNQQFERYRELSDAQQRVGSFLPKFLHDPAGPVDDIYRTIPTDLGNAILIGRLVQTFIREEIPAAK
ncbi:hypothetical protein GFPCMMHI_06396 [Ensifer adhaerens]|nr:hypothetical protein [Ensifer adhaerens]